MLHVYFSTLYIHLTVRLLFANIGKSYNYTHEGQFKDYSYKYTEIYV